MTRGRAVAVAVLSAVAAASLVLDAVGVEPGRNAPNARSKQRPPARTPDIHFVPTEQSVADAMLQLARVNANDVVYDLGSGDGRIVITAAQKYGARGVGIELDPRLVKISRETALEGAVEHKAAFIEGDLFTADISPATVVTLYLSVTVNMRLEAKLKRELRPGVRIVSQRFPIGSWKPDETALIEGVQLFLWKIPG